MYVTDESERSLGVFILISLILHALVFFLYPRWEMAAGSGAMLGDRGSIVRIIPVDTEAGQVAAKVTPKKVVVKQQTKLESETARKTEKPKKPEPRPQKKEESAPEPKPKPKPKPKPESEKPKETPPSTETKPPVSQPVEKAAVIKPVQEPKPPQPAVIPEKKVEPTSDRILNEGEGDQILTSEQGQEVMVAGGKVEEEVGEPEQAAEGKPETLPVEKPSAAEPEPPEPPAETEPEQEMPEPPQPPPLPPLPAASSVVMGGGRISYPKNAANEQLMGTVKLDIFVPRGQNRAEKVVIRRSSGFDNLDRIAQLTVKNYWRLEALTEDYVLSLTVTFTGPPRYDVKIEYDGIRYLKTEASGGEENQ